MEAYRLIGSSLYGSALRILRQPQDAEDAVQETFVRFFQKARSIRSGNLNGWLQKVIVNLCLDKVRAKASQSEELPAELPGPVAGGQEYAQLDLSRAVASLPEQARLVFLLHDLEGYKHREVAEALGINEGTSKSQLFRARELLRRGLEPSVREMA